MNAASPLADTKYDVDEYVGRQIRKRRSLLGLTQEQLAEKLSISYQQVQKYETGANRVSAGRLYSIAQILDVDIRYFFQEPNGRPDMERLDSDNVVSTRAMIELVRQFNAIPDDDVRRAITSLIRCLTKITPATDRSDPLS